MKQDLWAVWPDTYMCPISEAGEMMSPPLARSDDYEVVNVTAYDETSCPCEWVPVMKCGHSVDRIKP